MVRSEQYWSVCPIWIEECSKVAATSTRLSLPRLAHTDSLVLSPSFCSPSICLSSQKGLSPLHKTSGLGCAVYGFTYLIPRVRVCLCKPSLPFRSVPGAEVPNLCFYPSYPVTWKSVLYHWLLKSFSSFQLVSCVNCCT